MSTNITNSMPSDWLPGIPQTPDSMPLNRLYLQVSASAAAWVVLCMADVFITWKICTGADPSAQAGPHSSLLYIVNILLLCMSIVAGTISYRSWKTLAGPSGFLHAQGRERSEFMSLAGLYISFTLGAGMLWLGIPLFILSNCVRTR